MHPTDRFQKPACFRGNLTFLPILLALAGFSRVSALNIEGFGVDAAMRFTVRAPAATNGYYVLRRGSSITRIDAPVALLPGDPAAQGSMADPSPVNDRRSAFYRLVLVPNSAPLDSDQDGIDDLFELARPLVLDPLRNGDAMEDFDGDGLSNLEEFRAGTSLDSDERPVTVTSSPFDGETGVSVHRETVIRFRQPISSGSVVSPTNFQATVAGRRILGRVAVAADRRSATLFYQEPLPGSSRIRIALDTSGIRDQSGRPLDGDGNATPGGTYVAEFNTAATAPLQGTAVVGRVFASELARSSTNLTGVNIPLAGVIITVDGREETLRTTTDSEGRFRLEPAPAGRFFVHVDGRTAPASHWPDGAYYPVVGKAWEAEAGRVDNQAGGTGEIFLPLIPAGTLRAVSPDSQTLVPFPAEVVAANPLLEGVEIVVPPNALVSDNGSRGGRVGIAPVPPDRLPEPLPPGLGLPLVITVQSDGPQNFDQPVPVRFPNLPDPVTGERLPPGSRSALWSFNHDTGTWEVAGPMTVSDDGEFVLSVPGSGIRQPGWHGTFPANPAKHRPNPSPRDPPPDQCALGGASDAKAANCLPSPPPDECEDSPQRQEGRRVGKQDMAQCSRRSQEERTVRNARAALENRLGQLHAEVDKLRRTLDTADESRLKAAYCAGISRVGAQLERAHDAAQRVSDTRGLCNRLGGQLECLEAEADLAHSNCDGPGGCQPSGADRALCDLSDRLAGRRADIRRAKQSACDAADTGQVQVRDAYTTTRIALDRLRSEYGVDASTCPDGFVDSSSSPSASKAASLGGVKIPSVESADELAAVLADYQAALTGVLEPMDSFFAIWNEVRDEVASVRDRFLQEDRERFGELAAPLLYAIETSAGVMRGRTGPAGSFEIILPAVSDYTLHLLDPRTGRYGWVEGTTPAAGIPVTMPDVPWLQEPQTDTDGDGLSDAAEFVTATNPSLADTDSDGVSDGVEIAQQGNPLGAGSAINGIIRTLDIGGGGLDLAVSADLAAVITSGSEVAIVDISNPLAPTLTARIRTPPSSQSLAMGAGLLAVACGDSGVLLYDLSTPSSPRALVTAPVVNATSVAIRGGRIYTGTGDGAVVVCDAASGAVLQRISLGGASETVRQIVLQGSLIAARQSYSFGLLRIVPTGIEFIRNVNSPAGQFRDLAFSATHLWASDGLNLHTFDVSDPASATLSASLSMGVAGWNRTRFADAGLIVAAVGRNSTSDLPDDHNISTWRTTDATTPPSAIAEFITPGITKTVALANGYAFATDETTGFMVINYRAPDIGRVPPQVAVRTPVAGSTVASGSYFDVSAAAFDDVGIRQVEFYFGIQRVGVASAYPFNTTLRTPELTATQTNIVLRARAFDTGGNSAWSEPVVLPISPDDEPPVFAGSLPPDGSGTDRFRGFTLRFTEAIAAASLDVSQLRLTNAGPDLVFGTGDDTAVGPLLIAAEAGQASVRIETADDLPAGVYRLTVGTNIADLAGNHPATAIAVTAYNRTGATAHYFEAAGQFGPGPLRFKRYEPRLEIDPSPNRPGNAALPDPTTVRLRAMLKPAVSGVRSLRVSNASRVRIWLDGRLVFADAGGGPSSLPLGELSAITGHSLEIEATLSFAVLRVEWAAEGQPWEVISIPALLPPTDTAAPALMAARWRPELGIFHLRFDEPVSESDAANPANYRFVPALEVYEARALPNGTDVELITQRPAPGSSGVVIARGIRDLADPANAAAETIAPFLAANIVPGDVRTENFAPNDLGVFGIVPLTSAPGWPLVPSAVGTSAAFFTTEIFNPVPRHAAQRLSGWFRPPFTGNWIFALRGTSASLMHDSGNGLTEILRRSPSDSPDGWSYSRMFRLQAGMPVALESRTDFAGTAQPMGASAFAAPVLDGAFIIEAEDYDHGGGLHVAVADTMPYSGAAYQNLEGIPEIDYSTLRFTGNSYRSGTSPQPDGASFSEVVRHGGLLTTNWGGVQFDRPGAWINITRRVPAGRYRVFASATASFHRVRVQIGRVTEGLGTANQVVVPLGTMTQGADETSPRLIPMHDDTGLNPVVTLSGETTFRITAGEEFPQVDYLMLLPEAMGTAVEWMIPPTGDNRGFSGPAIEGAVDPEPIGFALRETWENPPGSNLAEFRAASGTASAPAVREFVPALELNPATFGSGPMSVTRMRGWIVPYRTGPHRFFMAANGEGEFWFETVAGGALTRIAREPESAAARDWYGFTAQTRGRDPVSPENASAVLQLEAGRRYEFELWVRQGFPQVGVTWQPPGARQPGNGEPPVNGLHLMAPAQ